MKKILLVIILIGGMFSSALYAKQYITQGEPRFYMEDLSVSLGPAPRVTYSNFSNSSSSGGRKSWAIIKTTFIPRRVRGDKAPTWYDNVTMEGRAILSTDNNNSTIRYVAFDGSCTYMVISGDGSRHEALFLIPPQLMDRYYVYSRNNFRIDMFKAVRVSFYGAGRVLLGEAYWYDGRYVNSQKDIAQAKAFVNRFDENLASIVRVSGGLFSKNETPWANLDFGSYDLIKSNSAGNSSGSKVKE